MKRFIEKILRRFGYVPIYQPQEVKIVRELYNPIILRSEWQFHKVIREVAPDYFTEEKAKEVAVHRLIQDLSNFITIEQKENGDNVKFTATLYVYKKQT